MGRLAGCAREGLGSEARFTVAVTLKHPYASADPPAFPPTIASANPLVPIPTIGFSAEPQSMPRSAPPVSATQCQSMLRSTSPDKA
jgi:hypothetical protein